MRREWAIIPAAVGMAFGARGLLWLTGPSTWDPGSALDWLAVIGWSLALLSLLPGTWLLIAMVGPARSVVISGSLVVTAALLAGITNILANGLGVEMFVAMYALAGLTLAVALAAFSVALALARQAWLSLIPLLTVTGLLATQLGGLFLVAGTWLALAWRMRREPADA